MRRLLFTKLFGARGVDDVGSAAAELGFDGIDLLIRSGATVDPGDGQRIPAVVKGFESHGLTVPIATTDLTDPAAFPTDEVLAGCAEAGIRLIRLGYWSYAEPGRASEAIERARHDLDTLAAYAARHEIRFVLQLHGGTIHASGALTRTLLEGRDPLLFGAYPDPGNQTVQDGREDWRLTFDLLEPWLACVGVKNGGWMPGDIGLDGARRWSSDWLGLADGMVPWPEILRYLDAVGFEGPLTFHSHYRMPYEQALDQTRLDLRYVDRILA